MSRRSADVRPRSLEPRSGECAASAAPVPAPPRRRRFGRLPAIALAAAAAAGVAVASAISGLPRTPACAEEAPAAPEARVPALRGLDPVELCGGREVEGRPEHVRQRGGYSYRFATGESARRFDADPAAFSVQFGGACMRMGPLAGRGSPDRWTVHEGRIYLFASESCRSTFLKEPARYIDRDDPAPSGSAEAVARGGELMRLAVRGLGGAEALAAARNVRVAMTTVQTRDGTETKVRSEFVIAFPSTYRWEQSGDGWSFAWLLAGAAGHIPSDDAAPADDDVRRHMVREMYRRPVAIVAAWARGEAKAVALDPEKRGDATFERVSVGVGGATSTLVLDAGGRVVEARFRHRAGNGIQDVARRFSDFRTTGGLVLPFATSIEIDGKAVADRNLIDSVDVNAEIPAERLAPPAARAPTK